MTKPLSDFLEELDAEPTNEDTPSQDFPVVIETEDGELQVTGVRFEYADRKVIIETEPA